MSSPLKALILSFCSSLLWTACGVKGKPQPPLEQPILGRGEMTSTKTSKSETNKKKKPKVLEPDWDEKDDFIEEKR